MPASSVLMVEPRNFISNPQTVGDNFFQATSNPISAEEINEKALQEFNSLRTKLEEAGIEVIVHRQLDELDTPDAIYPNNWFSTDSGKTLILYPMMAVNRRLERRASIIKELAIKYPKQIDLSPSENRGLYLEGTGSLVLDHRNKIAYASLSERTNTNLLFEWSKLMHFELVLFTSYDNSGRTVYHTNVVMCLAEHFAIVCLDAIKNMNEKRLVRAKLEETQHKIIPISIGQMHHFCANCISLQDKNKQEYLVMSDKAFMNFSPEQLDLIKEYCQIIHTDLNTIEQYGGGGARCMLAELF